MEANDFNPHQNDLYEKKNKKAVREFQDSHKDSFEHVDVTNDDRDKTVDTPKKKRKLSKKRSKYRESSSSSSDSRSDEESNRRSSKKISSSKKHRRTSSADSSNSVEKTMKQNQGHHKNIMAVILGVLSLIVLVLGLILILSTKDDSGNVVINDIETEVEDIAEDLTGEESLDDQTSNQDDPNNSDDS